MAAARPDIDDPIQEFGIKIDLEPSPAWLERLVVDPSVRPVQFTIKGTDLIAEELASLIEAGRTDDELLKEYPVLSTEDLEAIHHYTKVPPGLRRAFGCWAEEAEELDAYLDSTRRRRKTSRREVEE